MRGKQVCSTIAYLVYCATIVGVSASTMANDASAKLFNVREQGAVGDGEAIDTQAIQSTIDTCGRAGGGRVLFPQGRYLSGTLQMRDGVELHFADGATLVGVQDLDAYSGFQSDRWGKTRWNRGLIVGEGVKGIAITGEGTIDGNKVFDPRGEERMRGPHTILLADCQDVTVRDVTIHESANYAMMFYGSQRVRVEDATFEGGWDGVHFRGKPDAWNHDVRIARCKFYTGDDCIAGHYVEDAIVEDCIINSSCNGVRIIGPARRLAFQRCEFFGPGKFEHRTSRDLHRTNMLAALIIQPSAWDPTPGPLEDLCVRDVTIRDVACALHVSLRKDNWGSRVTVERLKATEVYGPALSVESWAEAPLGEVTLRDIDIEYAPDARVDPRMARKPEVQSPIQQPGADVFARKLPAWGIYGRNLGTLHLDRVRLTSPGDNDTRPVVRADSIGELVIEHLQSSPAPAPGMGIERNNVGSFKTDDSPERPASPGGPERTSVPVPQ